MITKPLSISRLKQLWLEFFLNKTDKVSDISDNSVLNATAYANSVIAQKAMKDISVVESQIMPDSANGEYLDNAVSLFGSITRKGASQSSTSLRLIADPSTFYDKTLVSFTSSNGVVFVPDEDVTIDENGVGYIKVRSQDSGIKTNVSPNSIINVNSAPTGHIAVTNEYIPQGGADSESDELLRKRLKKHQNIISRYTEEYYSQVFQEYNDNILKIITFGVDNDGKKTLGVVTQNGITLSESELDELLDNTKQYFSFRDINRFGDTIGIKLVNVGWHYVNMPTDNPSETGVDFRVQLWEGFNPDDVRKDIQIRMTKYLDFRYWKRGSKVEWDNLLQIVKETKGVRYVSDGYFRPNRDEKVSVMKLPRIKKFVMRDLSGNIISDNQGVLTPIFYPNA
ncbi:MAG: baseplate J/gp47 family protein [Novosphingobium sp.]|nr:baseplate J/gp47 family protein [Novosphingobium sp.]